MFVEKNQSLILIIPGLIVLAFTLKGISLYLARTIMIGVAEDIRAIIQTDMSKSLIKADTDYIDKKHTGKFLSNLTFSRDILKKLILLFRSIFFKILSLYLNWSQ